MPFKITFQQNQTWQGGAQMPHQLRDMSDLHEWIKNFLLLYKDLGKMYSRYFTNDNTLLGQEKSNLVIALDGLLGGLIMLRRYITKDAPKEFDSAENKYGYWFHIRVIEGSWSGRGKMSDKYTFKINGFDAWYNNVMMEKIRQMFRMYSMAMEDGILSDSERSGLILFIETVMFDILVIEKVLVTLDMKK